MNSGEKNINQTNNHAKQAKAKVSEAKHSPENKKTKRQLLMRLIKTEESQKKKDKKIMTNQDSLFFFSFFWLLLLSLLFCISNRILHSILACRILKKLLRNLNGAPRD